jgi:hypothetical protein
MNNEEQREEEIFVRMKCQVPYKKRSAPLGALACREVRARHNARHRSGETSFGQLSSGQSHTLGLFWDSLVQGIELETCRRGHYRPRATSRFALSNAGLGAWMRLVRLAVDPVVPGARSGGNLRVDGWRGLVGPDSSALLLVDQRAWDVGELGAVTASLLHNTRPHRNQTLMPTVRTPRLRGLCYRSSTDSMSLAPDRRGTYQIELSVRSK